MSNTLPVHDSKLSRTNRSMSNNKWSLRIEELAKLMLAFVLDDEPVRIRVGGEDSRLTEYVGGEDGTEPGHSLVDEGFRVLGLVGGDELKGFAYEGEAESARRESDVSAAEGGGAEEEEDKDTKREREKK
ncbi:hypothetical protein U1Q18_022331, partial [Sarracenia purpurea var. burkii]